MTVKDLDEKGDPGVVNPAFIGEELEDEGVDLGKDKEEFRTGRSDGDGMSDTDSVSSLGSTSSDVGPKFNLKMSPRPLRRSHRNRSPQHSPDSYRSSYQSNRSSVCSTRKGILKKTASSTTINMEMTNISQPQTPTENGHTSKFSDPVDDCENGEAPKFVRSTDDVALHHQRSFNRVKFILDSGRPDNVTGDYDDIKIEKNNERDRSSDRSKSLPDKEDGNGLSRSGKKCLLFAAGLLVLTMAVILGSLFGSRKLTDFPLKGVLSPLDDKVIRNAIEGRFKITNKDFVDQLHNYESDEFKKMSKDLEALIAKVIYHEATPNQANSTVTLRIIKILKGSIVPIFRIKWTNKDLLDDSEIRKRILRHLDKFGSIGEYKVDKTSVTVSDLQNHCHKSLSDCSHTCIFSPQTLMFLCRCPDTLVLTNNTLCISPQQTTRKMPFIVPPVVNNIIKDSGAQFHSVNPETVEKKAPEEVHAPEPEAAEAKVETKNKTITVDHSNATTTATPTTLKVPDEQPEKKATTVKEVPVNTTTTPPPPPTTTATTTTSTTTETPTTTVKATTIPVTVESTSTAKETDKKDTIEEVQVTAPMSKVEASEETTTAAPSTGDVIHTPDVPANATESRASSEATVLAMDPKISSANATTPEPKSVVADDTDKVTANKSDTDVITDASQSDIATSTLSSTASTAQQKTTIKPVDETLSSSEGTTVTTETTPTTSSTSVAPDTPSSSSSSVSTTPVNATEGKPSSSGGPSISVETTTEYSPSSTQIILTTTNAIQNTSTEATVNVKNGSVTHSVEEPLSKGSPVHLPSNDTAPDPEPQLKTVSVANETMPDSEPIMNTTEIKEVVTVQAILLASLPPTPKTTTVSPSTLASSGSAMVNISSSSSANASSDDPIPIGVIADVSNALSFGGVPGMTGEVGQENAVGAIVPSNTSTISSREDPVAVVVEELCSSQEFECVSGGSRLGPCIPKALQCDSVYDCYDQSDEKTCIENKCLGNYQCWSGDCIQRKFVCDGIRHCPDGGDEEGCETWKCSEDEFQCNSPEGNGKVCIPLSQKCDGQADCANHTDERDCSTDCSGDQFMCPEGWCIPNLWTCDGHPDCTGGEDELDCDCNGLDQSPCVVGGCVPTFKLCDGLRQCPDGSDEYGCLRIDNSTKQLEVRSEEKRWSAVCGDKWTAGWTELVCEQLGLGEAVSTEVRKVNESVPKPRVKLSPDAPKAAQRGRAPLQYFLTPGECSSNPLVHISCKQPTCGQWSRGSTGTSNSEKNDPAWPSLGLLIQPGSYDDINLAFSHSCAATIITPAWVIASYSCLSAKPNGLEADKWAFLIGEATPRVGQRETQLRHAKQVVMYPGAKRRNGVWVGDAVLLRLQSAVQLDESTQLACLPDRPADTHSHCKVVTWRENRNKDEGGLVQHVQKLPVPNLTVNTCNTSYYGGKLSNQHTCASFIQPSHSPCDGAEGSPLMCKGEEGAWQLHGLMSLTSTCARFDLPSLFTDISSINEWILSTVERASTLPKPESTTTTTTATSVEPRSRSSQELNEPAS